MILKFDKFEFKKGINTTVRKGIKPFYINEKMLLIDNNTADCKEATIKGIKYKRFCDLTNLDLCNEHNGQTRDYDAITRLMRKTYENFDTSEIVTIIDFVLDKH